MINSFLYPIEIDNVYNAAQNIKYIRKRKRNLAAGGCQIVLLWAIKKYNKGLYINPLKNMDRSLFKSGQKARSDIQFRKSVGGSLMISLPFAISLNHIRDKEAGYHIEIQR